MPKQKENKTFAVHNHPSNDLEPSESDLKFTKEVYNLFKAYEITMLDHLIVSENNFFYKSL